MPLPATETPPEAFFTMDAGVVLESLLAPYRAASMRRFGSILGVSHYLFGAQMERYLPGFPFLLPARDPVLSRTNRSLVPFRPL